MAEDSLVHWEGMSQSLQERFLDIEEGISNNRYKIESNLKRIQNNQEVINQMDTKIEELAKKITNRFNELHNKINNIVINGGMGQLSRFFIEQSELGSIARVDTKRRQLYGSRMLELKLVYDTDEDKELILAVDTDELYSKYELELVMYDLRNGSRLIYNHDENNWLDVGGSIDEFLPKYTFLMNPITHKLYFYECMSKWTDLSSLCDANSGTVYTW